MDDVIVGCLGCLAVVAFLGIFFWGLSLIVTGLSGEETSHYVYNDTQRDALHGIGETWGGEMAEEAKRRENLQYTTNSGGSAGKVLAGLAIDSACIALVLYIRRKTRTA